MEDECAVTQISIRNPALVFETLLLPSHFHRYVLWFANPRAAYAAVSCSICFCFLLIASQFFSVHFVSHLPCLQKKNSWITQNIVVGPANLRRSFKDCGVYLLPRLETL